MFRWLHLFPRTNRHLRKIKARKPPRCCLFLEPLEERCLLTVDPVAPIHFPEVLSADELLADPLGGQEPAAEESTSPENAASANTGSDAGSEGGASAGTSSAGDTGPETGQAAGAADQAPDQSLLEAMAAGGGQGAGAASSTSASSTTASNSSVALPSQSVPGQGTSAGLLAGSSSCAAVLVKQVLHGSASLPFGSGQ